MLVWYRQGSRGLVLVQLPKFIQLDTGRYHRMPQDALMATYGPARTTQQRPPSARRTLTKLYSIPSRRGVARSRVENSMTWQPHVALARYAGRRRLCNGRETPERRSVRVGKDWEEPFSSATHPRPRRRLRQLGWDLARQSEVGANGTESLMKVVGLSATAAGMRSGTGSSVQWSPGDGRDDGVYNGKEWKARKEERRKEGTTHNSG
ncbi:hypothetical protein FB45DRAFT_1004098 [Roridomyces roridus]|uniref:Uncharacterized protein n=1 Tax=Roridomyces roridus TaxID=1738132 RepID=A0AAD7BR20_9AGAR|nr:hypothetical protein FB45DRAFT_1004098 [Roridomyces roridus]